MATYFTPIPDVPNQIADADTFNDPMAELDAQIVVNTAAIGPLASLGTTQKDSLSHALGWAALHTPTTATLTSAVNSVYDLIVAASDPYATLEERLAAITFNYAGGNIATLTNGAADAGQKVVTVDSTTGFLAGAYVAYMLVGGAVEYNLIASITPTTVLTMTTNIGTGGIADDTYIGMISVSEYQAANAIPHGSNALTLPQTMEVVGRNVQNVMAYGAVGDGSTDDTAAFVAALAAGDTMEIPAQKTFKITSTLALRTDHTIIGNGSTSIIQFTPAAANDNLFEATEANRLKFINFKVTGTNPDSDCAFLLTNVNEVTFQDMTIMGFYGTGAAFAVAGIHLIGDTGSGLNNCGDIRIASCWIGGCLGDGIRLSGDYGSQFWVHHSRVTNNQGYGVWVYMYQTLNIIFLETSIIEGNYLGNILFANVTATRIIGCHVESAPVSPYPSIVFDGPSCQGIVIESCNIGASGADYLIEHQNTIASQTNYLRDIRVSDNRFTGKVGGKVFHSPMIVMGARFSQNFIPLSVFGTEDIRGLISLNYKQNIVIEDQYGVYYSANTAEADFPYPVIHFATDALRLEYPQTPATAGAAGLKGEIAWDASNLYVCVATNTWKKVSIATW